MKLSDQVHLIISTSEVGPNPDLDDFGHPAPGWCPACGHPFGNNPLECSVCNQAEADGFWKKSMIGRCASGAEADAGRLVHAVDLKTGIARCGGEPGRRSSWSLPKSGDVTCRRCLVRISRS